MVKESVERKCSNCGDFGHNSRTCNGKCVKLFGVNLLGDNRSDSIRKSRSTGDLVAQHGAEEDRVRDDGYLSDGVLRIGNGEKHEWNRGIPWSEEEHRSFLLGLEKLGKGDWRGISKKFVPSRTPTQVASHAQKYFKRQATNDKFRRRPSVFDIALKEHSPAPIVDAGETSAKVYAPTPSVDAAETTAKVYAPAPSVDAAAPAPSVDVAETSTKACNPAQVINQSPSRPSDSTLVVSRPPTRVAGIPGNRQNIPSATFIIPAISICQHPMGNFLMFNHYCQPICYSVPKAPGPWISQQHSESVTNFY